MNYSPSLPPGLAGRINPVCDRFEEQWLAGAGPRLEEFLPLVDESDRRALMRELLALELDYRGRRGEQPSLEEYRRRLPEFADEMAAAFSPTTVDPNNAKKQPGEHATSPPVRSAEMLDGCGHGSDCLMPTIPGYETEEILGRGGMGIVYKARNLALNRTVALKMVRAGAGADAEELARFQSEVRAAARLQHPNFVQIYEVGEHAGLPFCALELMEGGSLAETLAQRLPTPAHAARLVEILAKAMHFAHCRNVIHRDLKPGNILLASDGTPKVTDFGLARQLDVDSGQTRTGAVMGTPSYMAPEQASGQTNAAGPAADVYALGAILYAMLTGQPPFQGDTPLATLDLVRGQEPVPPSRIQPQTPRDLETICLKCLSKEPDKRYASSQELAEDLRRFVKGEPIRARPVGHAERLWRWARRNPTMAGLIALAHVLALAGLSGILWQWREAVVARGQAQSRAEAEARAKRQAELTLADMYTSSGMVADAHNQPALAVLWFAHAAKQADGDEPREQANRLRFATWERQTFQPVAAVKPAAEWLNQLAFHPVAHPSLGSRYLLTEAMPAATHFGQWTLWDLQSEKEIPFPPEFGVITAAAWNPQGTLLALGNEPGDVVLLEFHLTPNRHAGEQLPWGPVRQRLRIPGSADVLAFSANGHLLAVGGSQSARVWNIPQGAFVTPELKPSQAVASLNFDRSGTKLAVASRDEKARVYAVPSNRGECFWGAGVSVPHVRTGVNDRGLRAVPLLFVNADREFVTCPKLGELAWIGTANGSVSERSLTMPNYLGAVAADKDGHVLAVSSPTWGLKEGETEVKIIAASDENRRPAHLPHRPRTFMLSMTFSPDDQSLLTGCSDGSVQIWSMADGKPTGPTLLHAAQVQLVAFAPNPQWFATAQRGGLVRVWRLPRSGLEMTRLTHGSGGSFACVSADGRYVLPTGASFKPSSLVSPRVFDLENGQHAGFPLGDGGIVVDAVFAPACDQVVLARSGAKHPAERAPNSKALAGVVEFRNWRTGLPSRAFLPTDAEPRSLSFSPTRANLLAVLCADGQLLLVDVAAGIQRRKQAHAPRPSAGAMLNNGKIRFSPDGQALLTWGTDYHLRIWSVEDLELRTTLSFPGRGTQTFTDLQFSPDHRFLLAGARDNVVRIWEWNNGGPDTTPFAVLPHPDWPHAAQFSPDGKYVLTGCRDKQARLWDWQAGKLLSSIAHDHEVHAVAFTPSGERLLTACDDKTVRIWDARTGIPLTPALPISGEGGSIGVTQDGKYAVVGGFGKSVDVVHLDGMKLDRTRTLDELCRWAELLSGRTVHIGGSTALLTAEEWFNRWREFRACCGER